MSAQLYSATRSADHSVARWEMVVDPMSLRPVGCPWFRGDGSLVVADACPWFRGDGSLVVADACPLVDSWLIDS
jgi:hypothetical protein